MRRPGKKTRRCIGLFLSILFLFTSVFAFAQGETYKENGELFPIFSRWMREAENGVPYQIEVTAAVHALSPFTPDTVASLNRLVSAISGEFYLSKDNEKNHWQTSLLLQNQPLLSVSGLNEKGKETQWVNIKGVSPLYSTSVSPIFDLLGVNSQFEQSGVVQFPQFLPMKEVLFQLLADFTVEGVEKNTSYQFKNIGKAGKMVTYTFDENTVLQLQTFFSNLSKAGGWQWGMVQNNAMLYNGKGSLKVYYTKDGAFLGMEASAKALVEEEERNIEWLWATNEETNRFALSLPTEKGNKQLSLEGEVTQDITNQTMTFSGKHKDKNEEGKTETQLKGSLSGASAENNERITGEITFTTTKGEEVTTLTLQPSVLTMALGQLSPKGSIRIVEERNKKNLCDITLSLIATPCQAQVIDLSGAQDYDSLSAPQREALAQQITTGFSSAFLKAALTLPQDDIAFILEGLTEQDLGELYQALP